MHYVKCFDILGIDTMQVPCIELQGVPNTATEGAVGLLGVNMLSADHEIYVCIGKEGNIYHWIPLKGEGGTSVTEAKVNDNGELILTLSNGELLNAGVVYTDTIPGVMTVEGALIMPNSPTTPDEATVTDSYVTRVTANKPTTGLTIVDGSETLVTKITGDTVKSPNLINMGYEWAFTVHYGSKYYFEAGEYTFSCESYAKGGVSSPVIVFTHDDGSTITWAVADGMVTKTFKEGYYTLRAYSNGWNATTSNTVTSTITGFTIQKGNMVIPYFEGIKHACFKAIKSTGRNLIDRDETISFKTSSEEKYFQAGDYTISCESYTQGGDRSPVIILEHENGTSYSFDCFKGVVTHTLIEGNYTIKYFSNGWDYNNSVNTTSSVTGLMIQYGGIATGFEPYKESSYIFPEPLELGKWDSFHPQTGEVISNTMRVELNGTENWNEYGSTATAGRYFCNDIFVDVYDDTIPAIASLPEFRYHKFSTTVGTFYIASGSRNCCFNTDITKYPTLDSWKAYLATLKANGTPLVIEYQKVTPTVIKVDNAPKSYEVHDGGREYLQDENSIYGMKVTIEQTYAIHENPTEAANKAYVNNGLAKKLDKTGGTITGNLIVEGKTDTELGAIISKQGGVTYGLAYDNETYKLGQGTVDEKGDFAFNENEGLPIALRDDSTTFTDGNLVEWSADGNKFVDGGIKLDDLVKKTNITVTENDDGTVDITIL